MLKQKYFLADIFILSAEKQPIKLSWRKIVWLHSKHKEIRGKIAYAHYDNYDAIEVPFTDAIPSDYDGVMGVPISFLIKYCPEQFEILGITKTWFGSASKIYPEQIQIDRQGKKTKVTKLNDGAVLHHPQIPQNETYYIVDGKYYTQVYARVLIRHIGLQFANE